MILAAATLAALLHACAPAVSADTMRAIVAVESRGYSYAINDNTARTAYCVPGTRSYPCSREQAGAIAENAIAHGHSIDVGIAQVNSGNFRMFRVTGATMLEPCANLRVASAILAETYRTATAHFPDQRKALWHAIMAYNTGSLYAGETYVRSVVDAALYSTDGPAVPSVKLLERVRASMSTAPGILSGPRRPDSSIAARSAPLLAHSPLLPARRDLTETFHAAVSH